MAVSIHPATRILRVNILSGAARVARYRYPRSSARPVILLDTLRLLGFFVLVIDSVGTSDDDDDLLRPEIANLEGSSNI